MYKKQNFIEHLKMRGYARTTITRMALYLDYFNSYLSIKGIKDIKNITPEVIEAYKKYLFNYKKRNGKSLGIGSIFARLDTLKQYFKYLEKQTCILYNPTTNLELPKLKESLPKNILNEKEILNLLNEPDLTTRRGLRNRAILETIYSTGLRRQEIVNLNIYDIDLKKGILQVIRGKGGKDRTVPIGKTACKFIDKYIKKVRSRWLRGHNKPALFITIEGLRMKACTLAYTLEKYSRSMGLKFSCHSLRHSCATHMLKGGADIRVIQAILGHNSQNSTQIYTRVMPLDLKEMLKRCHPGEKRKNT